MPSNYFVSSQGHCSLQNVQLCPGGGWGGCLRTEWQLNAGKIKPVKGNSQKITWDEKSWFGSVMFLRRQARERKQTPLCVQCNTVNHP